MAFGPGGWRFGSNQDLCREVENITGYLNEKQQFKPVRENNLSDGRIGLAIWNGDVNFDDLKVYGPEGLHVELIGKLAYSWARIKFGLLISETRMFSNSDEGNISIGSIAHGNDLSWNNWRGIIDELRIWNRVLTAKKIPKDM